MWQGSVKSFGTRYWNVITFGVGFVIGVGSILIIFWKSITLSGEDTVDRTILLI
jgi:hypothetical protein